MLPPMQNCFISKAQGEHGSTPEKTTEKEHRGRGRTVSEEDNHPHETAESDEIGKDELEITFYRSSGPGGQRKNRRDTAVRIRHIPTGITATSTKSRYQSQNLKLAMERLREKLEAQNYSPPPRVATKIPRAIKKQRLQIKRKRSSVKQMRKAPDTHENE